MKGILADENFEGHLMRILSVYREPDWHAWWSDFKLEPVMHFLR